MRDNALLRWSLASFGAYWAVAAFVPGQVLSGIASLMLLSASAMLFVRYAPQAWRVVVKGWRDEASGAEGAHIGIYGAALFSLGFVLVGCYSLLWLANGQPVTWLDKPYGPFGRVVAAIGLLLFFFSNDVTRDGIRPPKGLWRIMLVIVMVVTSFVVGAQYQRMQMGGELLSQIKAPRIADCPSSHPVKGNKTRLARIFHEPGTATYDATVPELCFTDPAAAEQAGFRRVRR